jgi:diacylglycerol kinase family enzyme
MAEAGRITVIVNGRTNEGGKSEAIDGLKSRFAKDGALVTIDSVSEPRDLASRAAQAADRGDIIVAAGGDGTVSTVAAVAVERGATLGVLPMGTLNHFAKDAGVPQDLDAAVAAIVAGTRRDVDVAEVNGRIFINNSSVGIYPRLVWEREMEQRRGRRKSTAFAIAMVRTWRRYRTLVARLQVDDAGAMVRTPFVFVGNNEYKAEGFELGGRTNLDEGRLSVFLAPECGQYEFLMLPFRALAKRLRTGAPFVGFGAESVSVSVPYPRVSVARDGEVEIMQSPLVYRIRPRALRIIVPAPAPSTPS